MTNTIVLVLHGFGSTSPNETAKAILDKTDFTIVAPQLDYKDFDLTKDQIDSICENILENWPHFDQCIVVGTSFGGFWANYVVKKYGFKGVLVNPSLQNIDEVCKKLGFDIYVMIDYLKLYADFKLNEYKVGTYVDVLVGGRDKIVDPAYVMYAFPSVTVDVSEGHRFKDKSKVINMIVEASNNLSQ